MLVLTRKRGEKILIGDNVWITVIDFDKGKVRIGIEAPKDVPVYRQELLLKKLPPKATAGPSPPAEDTGPPAAGPSPTAEETRHP